MATDICLSVAKFSHATGVRQDNSIPWTHIVAENIYAIVSGEATTLPGGKLAMRIVQGTTVLESVNLGDCIDQAMVIRSNAARNNTIPSLQSLPIFGLTKDTALAIRYQLGDHKPRRIQLRMQSITDCRQLVNTLLQRGLDFQDQRPGTSRSEMSHQRPGSNEPRSRLLTAQSTVGFAPGRSGPFSSNLFQTSGMEAGSFSQHVPFRDAFRHVDSVEGLNCTMAPPRHLSRDMSLAPRNPLPPHFVGQGVGRYSTVDLSASSGPVLTPQWTSSKPPAASVGHPTPAVPQTTQPPAVHQWSSSTLTPDHPNLVSSTSFSAGPQTSLSAASPPTQFSGSLEYEIPPRRELPFKRPESHQSDSNRSRSRPGSSTISMPPLPKPKLAKDRPVSSSSLAVEIKGPGTRDASHVGKKPRSSVSASVPAKRALPMNELLWGANETSEQQASSRLRRSVPSSNNDKPGSANSKTQEPDVVEQSDRPTVDRDPLESANIAPLNSARGMHASSLEAFAKQSNEERLAVLDSFMVEKLQDPNFITLCEDVENCWRRIGFG